MKKASFALFLCILIFAPLAFGTSEPWSLLTVEILIALSVVAYVVGKDDSAREILTVPGLLPLLLLVGWIIFQLIPLPAVLVKILSPGTYQMYQPVWAMQGGNHWIPLTVYRQQTLLEWVRIFSYGLFYILTVQLLSQGEQLKKTVKICIWLGIGIAVLAILQKFSSADKLYWFRSIPSNARPFGPWVNRSQYCGYMEMMVPLVLAFFLYYQPNVNPEESVRVRIVSFFSTRDFNRTVLLGFGLLIAASSVFISLARGGIIALCTGLVFFFFLHGRKRSRYSSLLYIGLATGLILFVTCFGWDPILHRFGRAISGQNGLSVDRLPIWKDASKIFKHFWLTGSGFGTFVSIFPLFKTIPGKIVFEHAHNDYLELLTNGGIIGFALAAWFVVTVVLEGWKMIGRRRDRYSILVSIGALSGIVGMLVHSISDFNMHNGADGLYFFFLCGLLVAAGNTRLHYQGQATLLSKASWPSKRHLAAAGGLFLILALGLQGGSLLASLEHRSVKGIYLSRQLSKTYLLQIFTANRKAARFDPFSGTYPYYQGEVERYLGHPDKALTYYVKAAEKQPLEGAYLQRIGMLLPKKHRKYAEVLMEKGAQRTIDKENLMLSQAQWLLGIGERTKAIGILKQALAQDTKLVTVAIPLLQSFSFTREEVATILPQHTLDWLEYGWYLKQTGDLDGATYFYDHAFALLQSEKTVKGAWFRDLYRFYINQKEPDKALDVLRLGIAKVPDFAPVHIWMGNYYLKQGITYRAVEEYRQALLLEPNNTSVRNAVERLSGQ